MSASQFFIQRIEAAGFHMEVEGDGIAITPSSRLTDRQRDFIRQHRPEILAALTGQADSDEPLTPAQLAHAEAVRAAIRAGWTWHMGQWFAPGTWKTPEDAQNPKPPPKPYPQPERAATGSTGGGLVCCGDCSNYTPNRYGMGGIGNCAVLADPPGGLLWSRLERRCATFLPITALKSEASS